MFLLEYETQRTNGELWCWVFLSIRKLDGVKSRRIVLVMLIVWIFSMWLSWIQVHGSSPYSQ